MNKVIVVGRLTRDPELRKTANDTSVVGFGIAVDRRLSKEAEHPEADFFDVTAWSGTAEFIEKYFTKGMKIGIEGRLQSRKWQDKEGNDRRSVEIVAENVEFMESKKNTESDTSPKTIASKKSEFKEMPDVESDGLPF